MEDRIKLSYFYGREADQYSFYKIPKLLFTEEYFKKVSVEAKVPTYIIRWRISWMLWDAVIKKPFP